MFKKFENLNYAQRVFLKRIFTVIAIIVVAILLLFIGHVREISKYNDVQQVKKIEQVDSAKYLHNQGHIQDQIIKESSNSTDPVLRSIGQNHNAIDNISNPIIKFANDYYDFSNESQYRGRAFKAKNLVTKNILKNKNIFGSDDNEVYKKRTHSVLSDLSISQISQKGSNVTVLADAYYTTWVSLLDSNNQKYGIQNNSGDDKHNGSQWILLTINTKTKKITNMKMMFLNPNAHTNQNNMGNNTKLSGSGVRY